MSRTENEKVRKHALPPVVLYSLSSTLIIVGVLLVLVLLGWYGSTLLTDGWWHTFTIVYAYWLTRRIIATVISAGVLILIGTYMMQRQRITT
jgi:heme O synthase-like polyprenyltransferase